MAKNRAGKERFIAVYADWIPGVEPCKLGNLWPLAARGNEAFAFEFDPDALNRPELHAYQLDPHLRLLAGRQFCPHGLANFGLFLDSSPDRWGRMLMKRRLDRQKRNGLAPEDKRLVESDYLLGVHDEFRVGALRFRLNDAGDFLDDNHDRAAPPLVQLRALEEASLNLERNPDDESKQVDDWLKMLISPGGSLGGARPKASVIDPDGHLWIAKFPSTRDTRDMGAWELVVLTLAQACGIKVSEALLVAIGEAPRTVEELLDRWTKGYLEMHHKDRGELARGTLLRHAMMVSPYKTVHHLSTR
jgi:serine/threonine-protein kinase HipA